MSLRLLRGSRLFCVWQRLSDRDALQSPRELGHGVESARMEGMAFQNSLDGEPQSPNDTMLLDRLHGIVRARRIEATTIGEQGRDHSLIHPDREDEYLTKHASILLSNVPFDN